MKIHEYQARDLLAKAGVPVPPARVVDTPDAACEAFLANNAPLQVVKAQVFAGGRGKAGFVKLVKTADEARDAAAFMLGNRMVSVQTGPEGVAVNKILIAAAVDIAKEYYLGITLDRAKATASIIASAEGGVEIETVAKEQPEAIIKEPLHPLLGLQSFQGLKVAKKLGFSGKQAGAVSKLLQGLAKVFVQYDCSLAEINPLVVTKDGQVLAIDAKINFDDNALFRHPEITALADESESNPLELRAGKAGLNYIKLEGTIGCLVNGAGLAMATMDVIQLNGGKPANFLDVGGAATAEKVAAAFRILCADPRVRVILINIFGGIVRCDLIAEGVLSAMKETAVAAPIVARLEGNMAAEGRKALSDSGLRITPAESLEEAAIKAVSLTKTEGNREIHESHEKKD